MPQPLRPGRDPNHPEDRTLVAVDIDGFGRQARTNLIRVKLRRRLDGWCGGVLTRAQASKEQWVAQDTGSSSPSTLTSRGTCCSASSWLACRSV